MDVLFQHTCSLVEEDMKGQFSLVELKMTHLDLLDLFQLRCEGMLTKIKAVLSGNAAAGDVVIYPSLASARSVALRRFPGSTRSLFDPAWSVFLLRDHVSARVDVDIRAEWLAIRLKLTTVSEYQDERRKRDERSKALQAELVRDLTKGKAAAATKPGGGAAVVAPATAEEAGSAASRELALVKSQLLALQTASPTTAGGNERSEANEARRAANRALTKAGKWTIYRTAYDTRKTSQDKELGAL